MKDAEAEERKLPAETELCDLASRSSSSSLARWGEGDGPALSVCESLIEISPEDDKEGVDSAEEGLRRKLGRLGGRGTKGGIGVFALESLKVLS